MNLIIDNQKAVAKWKPVLESLGVSESLQNEMDVRVCRNALFK